MPELTDSDRDLIKRARKLAGLADEAALRKHAGEPDSVLFAYIRVFGEAKHLLAELAGRLERSGS
jgi:hypothetical protein